jgi:hypothetical protein
MKTYTFEEYMKGSGFTKKDYALRKKWFYLGWNTLEKLLKHEMIRLKKK